MKKILSIVIVLTAVIFINSCGKYEEGPSISLKSKTARVTGEWKTQTILFDGEEQDLTEFMEQYFTYVYEKDGTGKRIGEEFEWTIGNTVYNYPAAEFALAWEFNANKEKIIRKITETSTIIIEEKHTIIKLKEKELWYTIDDTIEVHMAKVTI